MKTFSRSQILYRFLFTVALIGQWGLSSCQNTVSDETNTIDSAVVNADEGLVQEHPVNPSEMPQDYFIHPVKLPLSLSATFGEIRSNHFHGGLDIRVGGKIGEPVYAAADGYVSRIKITPYGGGKHIYITHPNGLRTVYMHLNDYCGDLKTFVRDYQYKHRVFAFDIDLPPDSIPVSQGQLIAHAGNTGSSGGPHLHYEIRYADNDQPINPLYFGIEYNDPLPPTIVNIKLYPADTTTLIDGKSEEWVATSRRRQGKRYISVTLDSATVQGRFYTGIYTYDMSEKSGRHNGVERIELYVDGELFSTYSVPTYIYEETRSINTHIDYPQYLKNKEYYILSRVLPGVRYPKTITVRGDGYLCFYDNAHHTLEYRVYDYKGNVAKRTLSLRSVMPQAGPVATHTSAIPDNLKVSYLKPYRLDTLAFRASLSSRTLYADDYFDFKRWNKNGYIGPVFSFKPHNNPYPPAQTYTIAIRIPASLQVPRNKLTIAMVGKNPSACETRHNSGWLEADVRAFGAYSIVADTVSPTVKPLNFKSGMVFTGNELKIKITDDLSGINTYNCYINNRWVLAEYDPKVASIIINAKSLKKGANEFTVKITDAVGNLTEETYNINR